MGSAAVLWRRLPDVLAETPVSPEEFLQLGELVVALDDSCRRFDAGDEHALRPLAATVVVLVHDSATSTSLLTRLGLKAVLPWADGTVAAEPTWVLEDETAAPIPIVSMLTVPRAADAALEPEIGGDRPEPAYTAEALGARWVPFDAWWESPRIYGFPDIALARRDLVLEATHDDLDGHVDPSGPVSPSDDRSHVPHTIHRLGGPGGLLVELAVRSPRDDSPVPAAIRQVAEEVRFTLRATLRERLGALVEAPAARHPLSAPRS